MRKRIVAGNWKMNKTLPEALELTSEVCGMLDDELTKSGVEVIFIPPFPFIYNVSKLITNKSIVKTGAQDCHQAKSGAYTGEVSAAMLGSLSVEYVILGHSERRQYFQESNELIAQKITAALAEGLKIILCIGEKLEERESGAHFNVVKTQLAEALKDIDTAAFSNIVLAYEPVWAIGTGKTASSEQAQEMHAFIRNWLKETYGAETAAATSILYGGSCNPSNAKELFSQADIDGGLIGGASLKSRDFTEIVKAL